MKRISTLIAGVLITAGLFSQAPQKISYQSVVRNSSDELVTNSNIGIQISILQGSISGTALYVERHFPTTNDNGLVSLEISTGTVVSGDFSAIDWSGGPYFIKTDIDLNGGANYTISGTSELLSVPYALLAKNVENISEADPLFSSSVAGAITPADTSSWNNKLDSYSETDPVFLSSVAGGITSGDTTKWNNKLDSFTESDPVFTSSLSNNITAQDTTRWGNDSDDQNELQQLSQTGNSIFLSNTGGVVYLPDSVIGHTNVVPAGFGTTTTVDIAALTFSLSKQRTVLILADVNIWGGGPCEETIRLSIDGTPINNTAVHIDNQAAITGNNGASASTSWMTTLGAGSHTIKLRAWGGCPLYKHPHLHVLVLGN